MVRAGWSQRYALLTLMFMALFGLSIDAGNRVQRQAWARSDNTEESVAWLRNALAPSSRGRLLVTTQAVDKGILAFTLKPADGATVVEFCLPAVPNEHFYGLGERFGSLDLAGQVLENWTLDQALDPEGRTSYSPTPFLLSSQGYGLLLETTAHATFDLRIGWRGVYCIRVATRDLKAYLITGDQPQTILKRHAQLVGLPPLPPPWALGVWKNLIGGQARVEQDVARLRQDNVPVDVIWIYDAVVEQAKFGWPWPIYGPIQHGAYPDLPALIRRLHAQELKVLGYLNHFLYPDTACFVEAERNGFLVQTRDGAPYIEPWMFTPRGYVDFTSPAATAWWQAHVHVALHEVGFDGAMLDFGETAPVDARYAGGVAGDLVHNQYVTSYVKAAYEVGQAAKPDAHVFFTRAGYSGSQSYTTGRFTGDQVRSWDQTKGLPAVVAGMLNGGVSGWPYWGPDIAGFVDGAPGADGVASAQQRQAEKELWIRWVQLGAVSPTMRDMLGMQKDPVGLWTDDETLAVFRAYARLHRALNPYLYRYAQVAHTTGLPILRPLFLNYPDEATTYTLEDEFLIGDDLLAAPVLQPGQTTRRVYLPAGVWQEYWTSATYTGPIWVTVAAPLHRIPLFLRQGGFLTLADLPTPADFPKT